MVVKFTTSLRKNKKKRQKNIKQEIIFVPRDFSPMTHTRGKM